MIKKIISLIAAAGILASAGMPAAYAKVGLVRNEAADTFESYDVTPDDSPFKGAGTKINDNWSIIDGGWENKLQAYVTDYSGDKKLRLSGGGSKAIVKYTGDTDKIIGDAVMEVDMNITDWNVSGGVRFLVSEDGNSYYELFAKQGDKATLSKVVSGKQESSVVVTEGWTMQGLAHIKMEMKDSKLTLYYTKNGVTTEKYIEDDAPLTAQGSATTCALIAGDKTTIFDNFKYYSEKMDYDDSVDVAVSDDFESYEISGSQFTGTGTQINDNWTIMHGGYNNNMSVSIKDYSGDKKMAIQSSGGDGAVIYTGDTSGIIGDAVMEVDMKVTDWNGKTGVRFLMSADGKSYYQLYAIEGDKVTLSKVVNGTQESSVVVKEGWGTAGWAHIKMEMKKSKLTLYYTKEGGTTIEKSIEDDTPLTAQGSATTCAFLDGQNEMVFDNFKLTCTKEKHYSVNTNPSVSDDFESHELTDTVNGKGTQITDDWAISNTKNGWDQNGAKGTQGAVAEDIKNTTRKVLKMIGTGNMDNAISYIGDRTGIVGDKAAVETDMYYATSDSSSGAQAGIRFLVSKDEKTYYQVMFGSYGAAPVLTKVIDGTVEERADFTPAAGDRIFDGNKRNHIGIELNGNDLTAVVTNGGNTYTAKMTVGREITADGNNTTCQFVTYGDKITAYYDNFKYYCSDEFAGRAAEPSDVMYVDIFANGKVAAADNAAAINNGNDADPDTVYSGKSYTADLGSAKIVRKAVLVNPTVTDKVRILASADGNDWEYLGSFNSGVSEFVNLYTNVGFRYIQLLSDSSFSFGDLRILTDGSADVFESRLNTSLYLYPRVDGVNIETPEWTYSNAGFVSAEGNKAVPINVPADGTVTVTANGTVSAQIRVLPAYRAVKNEDGTVTFNMGFNFYTSTTKLIAVYYGEDGSVMKVDEITPVYETNTNLDEIELTVTPPEGYASAKLLCWDGGFVGMTPVSEAMDY